MKRNQVIILVLTITVLGITFYLISELLPVIQINREIKSINTEINDSTNELTELIALSKNVVTLKEKLGTTAYKFEYIINDGLLESRLSNIIDDGDAELKNYLLKEQGQINGISYKIVEVKLIGLYTDICTIIKVFENCELFIQVQDVDITKANQINESTSSENGKVEATIALAIYSNSEAEENIDIFYRDYIKYGKENPFLLD